MAYADVDVIVEGALEHHEVVTQQVILDVLLNDTRIAAENDGLFTEVFVLWHDHDQQDECSCAQYCQDTKPYATFGSYL